MMAIFDDLRGLAAKEARTDLGMIIVWGWDSSSRQTLLLFR